MARKPRTSVPFATTISSASVPRMCAIFGRPKGPRPVAYSASSTSLGSGRVSSFRTEGGPEPINRDRQRVAGDSAPDQFFARLSNSQPLTSRLAYFRHSCLRFHCRILAKASRAEAVIESGERRLFIRSAERTDTNIATGRHLTRAFSFDRRSTACAI